MSWLATVKSRTSAQPRVPTTAAMWQKFSP